ncbi:BQ2448_7785 [Microbotryum intermedium]|uniref:BQ2448_7785 protein n=1 Tax=Microbotryum intermedium TaxID=269621 RepID=A0A238FUL2_9BASI|nr:BQ2448_7785 [Microbotryum intermedium]
MMMSEKSGSSLSPSPPLISTRHGSPPLQPPRSPLLIPGSPGFSHAHSYTSSPDMDESSRPLLPRVSFSSPASPTSATSVHMPRLPSRRRWPVLTVLLVLIVCGAWLQRDGSASVSLRHAKTGLKHLGNKLNDITVVKPWSGTGTAKHLGNKLNDITVVKPWSGTGTAKHLGNKLNDITVVKPWSGPGTGGTEPIAADADDADWDDTTQADTTSSRPTQPDPLESEPEPEESTPPETLDDDGADRSQGLDMPLDAGSGKKQAQTDEHRGSEKPKEIEAKEEATANDEDASEAVRITPSLGNENSDVDAMEQAEEEMEEEDTTLSQAKLDSLVQAAKLNVRPYPRDPPRDPRVAATKRYLAFDSHSGFHNQRKSLVNALILAKMLNRTLLLAPVRLGRALAWGPDVWRRILHDEECKAGLPVSDRSLGECKASDSDKWTYVAWSYLIQPGLVKDRDIVDRWNSSMKWVFMPAEEGGLGLAESDVYTFADPVRRSWQIYDDSKTSTNLGPFTTRLNLEDLVTGPISEHRMIRFGSLFSGARMVTTRPENIAERKAIDEAMILQQPVLDAVADQVRDRLGSYSAVHLRVGDGFFLHNKFTIMAGVFRKAVKGMFRLRQVDITALLDQTEERQKGLTSSKNPQSKRSLPEIYSWHGLAEEDNDPDELQEIEEAVVISPPKRSRRSKQSSPRLRKRAPMSSTLKCRKPLHTEKYLLPLNSPLYIATDSRNPIKDPALAPFFDHFPCAFLLNDFAAVSEYNSEPVEELVHLVSGGLKSDWDGQNLAQYFFGFLEAEIAARGTKIVGTPGSTFSGYTSGILHKTYVAQGLASPAA